MAKLKLGAIENDRPVAFDMASNVPARIAAKTSSLLSCGGKLRRRRGREESR